MTMGDTARLGGDPGMDANGSSITVTTGESGGGGELGGRCSGPDLPFASAGMVLDVLDGRFLLLRAAARAAANVAFCSAYFFVGRGIEAEPTANMCTVLSADALVPLPLFLKCTSTHVICLYFNPYNIYCKISKLMTLSPYTTLEKFRSPADLATAKLKRGLDEMHHRS